MSYSFHILCTEKSLHRFQYLFYVAQFVRDIWDSMPNSGVWIGLWLGMDRAVFFTYLFSCLGRR